MNSSKCSWGVGYKEEREMRRFNRIITAALCSAMLVPAAYAQTAQSSDDSGDEPIIVTATLRAMDVQDIPLAVTAVAPEALERQGVNDIKNLASISPSINIQSSQTETQGTSIKVRGVGTTGNNTGLESSVGVFIDGVYQSRPGVALGDLVDIERLEILRGPQGTLFGRNTSAGALNVSTKRPSLSTTEGFVNASYGNYKFMNLQGGVSLPVVQDVAGVRLSGTWRKRDGYLNPPQALKAMTVTAICCAVSSISNPMPTSASACWPITPKLTNNAAKPLLFAKPNLHLSQPSTA
jgi:outer membrane receptor protein involved in Fe transport